MGPQPLNHVVGPGLQPSPLDPRPQGLGYVGEAGEQAPEVGEGVEGLREDEDEVFQLHHLLPDARDAVEGGEQVRGGRQGQTHLGHLEQDVVGRFRRILRVGEEGGESAVGGRREREEARNAGGDAEGVCHDCILHPVD